jgi:hypothetical protein
MKDIGDIVFFMGCLLWANATIISSAVSLEVAEIAAVLGLVAMVVGLISLATKPMK